LSECTVCSMVADVGLVGGQTNPAVSDSFKPKLDLNNDLNFVLGSHATLTHFQETPSCSTTVGHAVRCREQAGDLCLRVPQFNDRAKPDNMMSVWISEKASDDRDLMTTMLHPVQQPVFHIFSCVGNCRQRKR